MHRIKNGMPSNAVNKIHINHIILKVISGPPTLGFREAANNSLQ